MVRKGVLPAKHRFEVRNEIPAVLKNTGMRLCASHYLVPIGASASARPSAAHRIIIYIPMIVSEVRSAFKYSFVFPFVFSTVRVQWHVSNSIQY